MTLLRRIASSLVLVLLIAGSLPGQAGPPIFPLSEVRPGLKGVGRTIFEGDKIDEFQVEILGVLKNALAPHRDLILGRLTGGPLAVTGVISGMSGSPVYVDGKLLGAVSRAFPLSKGAIAGITPIEDMLAVKPTSPTAEARSTPNEDIHIVNVSGGMPDSGRVILNADAGRNIPIGADPAPSGAGSTALDNLLLPLRFGGFSNEAVNLFAPQLRRLGLDPIQGGVIAGGAEDTPPSPTDLQPGSMISLLLVKGDFNLTIDCTVTMRDGNNLYACGHQVLAEGPAQFPFAPAHVVVTVPSIASSFKVDSPGAVMGTIRQDRFDAIYGLVGEKTPPMIPVHLHLESPNLNRKADYNFEMVDEPFLSPILLNLVTTSALSATERAMGTSTLNLKARISLVGGKSVNLEDVLSGESGTINLVGARVAAPLSMLMSSGFADLQVQDIDLRLESLDEKRGATLESVWTTKSEVRPGDHLEVSALIRLPGGATLTEKIPVNVPEGITDKMLQLVVGGGSSINALEFRLTALNGTARDSRQLVTALNRMRRNNRVYALLLTPQRSFMMQGDEYPSPPPSLLQTFVADPASSNVTFSGTSVVGDFETNPTLYAINGQKMLILKVAGSGM